MSVPPVDQQPAEPGPRRTDAGPSDPVDDDVLVRVENMVKYFPVRTGGLVRRTVGHVQAVDNVSLSIPRGKTLGLVGETEELRKKAVSEDRHAASAEVAEKIAAAPESEGSAIV